MGTKIKIKLTNILLTVGIVGSLIFFPIQMKHNHNCLFDWFQCYLEHSAQSGPAASGHHFNDYSEFSVTETMTEGTMLDDYLRVHSWLWWASIGLVGYILLTKTKQRNKSSKNLPKEAE